MGTSYAFGIDISQPGVEKDHFYCAGYYSCTETGCAEIVLAGMHVWMATQCVYDVDIKSDVRAPAYEPMLIEHMECTIDGLAIRIFGHALLNMPRLSKYKGAFQLPSCMAADKNLYSYTNWLISGPANAQEGFVGVRIGQTCSPPDLTGECEDTIGVICYTEVSGHPPRIGHPFALPLSAVCHVFAGVKGGQRRATRHQHRDAIRSRPSSPAR